MELNNIRMSTFFDAETNQQIKALLKTKKINLADLKICVKSALIDCYNTILESCVMREIDWNLNGVVYDETIADILNCYNIPFERFHKCVNAGLLTKCGRGYTFNSNPLALTRYEHNRLETLMYEFEIVAL